jgi:hypothetical protein
MVGPAQSFHLLPKIVNKISFLLKEEGQGNKIIREYNEFRQIPLASDTGKKLVLVYWKKDDSIENLIYQWHFNHF